MPLILSGVGYAYSLGQRGGTAQESIALDRVDFDVRAGELVLIVGRTGSGKSTLLRLAAGLLPMQTGSGLLDGAPLTQTGARGAVGLCFQTPESQLFAETLAEDAAFGPRNLGAGQVEAAAAANEALLAVGLPPEIYGARSPFALSGGEARRAALAGVLAMRPRYLLVDEPTAGLDARGRRLVCAALERARGHAGVAVVTHDAAEFLGQADRVLVLDEGRSRYWGGAEGLMRDPSPLVDAGLEVPDVLAVQHAARTCGLEPGEPTLDPREAADALARAGGWTQ